MKSICFISPYAYPLLVPKGRGPGGAERQFLLFALGLAAKGWDISFITEKPSNEFEGLKPRLPVYTCSFSYLGGSNLRIPLDWLSLLIAMKKADSTYYVLKVPGHLLAPMSFFCKFFRRNLVFWSQMNYDANPSIRGSSYLVGLLHDYGIRNSDLVIAQTTDQKENFKINCAINASIVPSICSTISSEASKEFSEYKQKGKRIDVLWVGNSTVKKRYEVVLELAKLMPHIHFGMAMNMADSDRYKEAEKKCLLIDNIKFFGMLPPIQMEQIFPLTKIFLNTSTQEGFPNTYLQSWMNGIPTLTLNIDPDNIISTYNLGKIIGNHNTSKVFDYYTLAIMLKNPIEELLVNLKLRKIMGENARKYVLTKHTPEIVVSKLEKILLDNNKYTKL